MSLREKLFGKAKSFIEKVDELKDKVKPVATKVASVASGRAAVAAPAAAINKKFGSTEEEKAAKNKEIEQQEIATQIETNRKMGYESDELGNIIEPEPDEVLLETQGDRDERESRELVPEFIPEEDKGIVGSIAKQFNMRADQLSAQLMSEALTSSKKHLDAAEKREGAIGPGQHTPSFIKDWSPIFETTFGKPYDPRNREDNITLTGLAMSTLIDRLGSWEAALVAYNKGESVVRQYEADPYVGFDDDPYVIGVKSKLK